jgi:hypothetical protein
MKKLIPIIIAIALILIGTFTYSHFFKDNSKTAEVVTNTNSATQIKTVKSGSFIAIDSIHKASGDVTVEDLGDNYKISFQDNFNSTTGPDLYVYLSSSQNFKNLAVGGVDTSKTLNLGKLQSTNGKQEYLVSKKDFDAYSSAVIIWCKTFSVQFSRAELK